jgi:transcriptional regulator with XRE-family HTH domain
MTIEWTLVGKRLREKRLDKGLTQERLAEMANTSNIYICRIENGLASPTVDMLSSICNVLECPVSYLLEGMNLCEYDANARKISRMLDGCSPYIIKIVGNIVKNIVDTDKG